VRAKASKTLYLHLDPVSGGPAGQRPRVLGPFRVVQFTPDGIHASASTSHPLHLATVNAAGHYFLVVDNSEWGGARVMALAGEAPAAKPGTPRPAL
jgi:hypothetical protein